MTELTILFFALFSTAIGLLGRDNPEVCSGKAPVCRTADSEVRDDNPDMPVRGDSTVRK